MTTGEDSRQFDKAAQQNVNNRTDRLSRGTQNVTYMLGTQNVTYKKQHALIKTTVTVAHKIVSSHPPDAPLGTMRIDHDLC
jgi:hypothetical protein